MHLEYIVYNWGISSWWASSIVTAHSAQIDSQGLFFCLHRQRLYLALGTQLSCFGCLCGMMYLSRWNHRSVSQNCPRFWSYSERLSGHFLLWQQIDKHACYGYFSSEEEWIKNISIKLYNESQTGVPVFRRVYLQNVSSCACTVGSQ